ncbi:HAD family hydrolase [Shouchella shacheensis]|uniref:HAD family hydrolase n=1 Tax=Shouchella shacheensis TaxID=1649580 RepID=UPI0007401484|nr:HAD family phosphatase [Shouchella shacheensis]
MTNQLELVIFDMDGLMFNTEWIGHLAWERVAEELGFSYSIDVHKSLLGKNHGGIVRTLKDRYGEEASVEQWLEANHRMRETIIQENGTVEKKPGLDELLAYLLNRNLKIAVASSSNRDHVIKNLEMEGIRDYFDVIVGGDQVIESKPNPEIFLLACEKAGTGAKEAIVLEDSYNGFLAAKEAGIPLFFVPDLLEATDEVNNLSAGVFESLHDVKTYIESNYPPVKTPIS